MTQLTAWLIDRMLAQGPGIFGYRHPATDRLFPIYPDPRHLTSDRNWLLNASVALEVEADTKRICGVAAAGIPLASVLAQRMGVATHVLYPRRQDSNEPFFYGDIPLGDPLMVVDDATGIGITKLRLIEALVADGQAVVLLTLQAQGRALLPQYRSLGVEHRFVYDCLRLVERAREVTLISEQLAQCCHHWLLDDVSWDRLVGPAGYEAAAMGCDIFTLTRLEILERLDLDLDWSPTSV